MKLKVEPKFKIGDRVILDPYPCKIADIQWKDGYGFVYTVRGTDFGKIVKEDELVFDERPTPTTDEIIKNIKADWNNFKNRYNLPNKYHFVDKNGNEINISEIVLEKKKPKYPKTYEECAALMDITWQWHLPLESEGKDDRKPYERKLDYKLARLKQLLICRDAYRKLAGEEMGLGKPWKPSGNEDCFIISRSCGEVFLFENAGDCEPFEFPTREMRDAFYENFKEIINECKELL